MSGKAAAVELVAELHRRQGEMYAGGSTDPVVELLAEDVVWHVPGGSPIAGDHRGTAQVVEYFERRRRIADATMRMHPGGTIGEGDAVAQFVEGSAVLDGERVSWRTIGVYRVDAERRRIHEVWLVPLDGELFDRIWSGRGGHDSPGSGGEVGGCALRIADDAHLRPLDETDARELHELVEANRAYLARWLPWAASQTLGDTRDFIRRTRSQLTDNDGFQAALVLEGRIAGVAGYHAVDWGNRATSIGYWLDEGRQGRGLMTAAVRRLVDHALSAWGLMRVEIRAATENRRSRAIPERLGFRQEGILRRAELVGGRYLDSVVYSMTNV
jgi:ribosomal-protein-serine acetyltransferase